MAARRAVAIVGGVGLLAAWLGSAAGIIRGGRDAATPAVRAAATSGAESLAADVQAQAARLRDHLSRAPMPQPAGRNPFRFEMRRAVLERPAVRAAAVDVVPARVPVVVPPPPLKLEGVAEREVAGAKKRTAILSSLNEIYFVLEGDTIASRYRVVAIGADAVELEDLSSGAVTRLAIR